MMNKKKLSALCEASTVELEGFLSELLRRKYAAGTIIDYHLILKQFHNFLEQEKVARLQNVDAEMIERYRLSLIARNNKPYTVAKRLCVIRKFFFFLEETGHIFLNPTANLILPHITTTVEPLSVQEMKKLIAVIPANTNIGIRDRALVELIYTTGCLAGELVKMTIFDIESDIDQVRLSRNGQRRNIPIEKQLSLLLKKYACEIRPVFLRGQIDNHHLWVSYQGYSLDADGLLRTVKRYEKATGLNKTISIHSLRHTAILHKLDAGMPAETICGLLGYKSVKPLARLMNVSASIIRNWKGKTDGNGKQYR